jgi:hypothetical protein
MAIFTDMIKIETAIPEAGYGATINFEEDCWRNFHQK